jgi:hypothetical protein
MVSAENGARLNFAPVRDMLETFGEVYSLDPAEGVRGNSIMCEYFDRRRAADVIESMHGRDMFVHPHLKANIRVSVCQCGPILPSRCFPILSLAQCPWTLNSPAPSPPSQATNLSVNTILSRNATGMENPPFQTSNISRQIVPRILNLPSRMIQSNDLLSIATNPITVSIIVLSTQVVDTSMSGDNMIRIPRFHVQFVNGLKMISRVISLICASRLGGTMILRRLMTWNIALHRRDSFVRCQCVQKIFSVALNESPRASPPTKATIPSLANHWERPVAIRSVLSMEVLVPMSLSAIKLSWTGLGGVLMQGQPSWSRMSRISILRYSPSSNADGSKCSWSMLISPMQGPMISCTCALIFRINASMCPC